MLILCAEINFFGSVIHGIEKLMSKNGYNVLIYQSNELYEFEKKGIGTFLRSQVEDFTALGAIQSIKAANKKIPGDIAIAGFANEAFGEYITPSLSTVNQRIVHMGEEAVKLFFETRSNKEWLKIPFPKLVLQPELICRQSSIRKKHK
jgi:DNA-binding LacI/PurR family transcriptional regulator